MTGILVTRVAGVALGVVLAACVLAAPAHAEGELGLSWDGRTWSNQLTGPLFNPAIRWVPGDERANGFFVRNQAADGADLAVAVDTGDRDRLLANDDIHLAARVGQADWVDLDRVGNNYPLTERVISAGEQQRVQVRASFDPASTNQSMTKGLNLTFRVILSDAVAGGGDGETNGGLLPETGAPAMGWGLLAAAAMIGVGAAMVRRSSEKQAEGVSTDV